MCMAIRAKTYVIFHLPGFKTQSERFKKKIILQQEHLSIFDASFGTQHKPWLGLNLETERDNLAVE